MCACVIERGRPRELQSLWELPHHLLPWQLNSQEWKRRNEGRQTGKGGEENWMKNMHVWEWGRRGRRKIEEMRWTLPAPFTQILFVLQGEEYEAWYLLLRGVHAETWCSPTQTTGFHWAYSPLAYSENLLIFLLSWNCRYNFSSYLTIEATSNASSLSMQNEDSDPTKATALTDQTGKSLFFSPHKKRFILNW